MKTIEKPVMNRRLFMKTVGLSGCALLPGVAAVGQAGGATAALSEGDSAILRFLAAAEILEADAWQQYNELASGNPAFQEALEAIDDDMGDYIEHNTDDEFSHADFLNGFLMSKRRKPISLDQFRTLPSSQATGAAQVGRLTNLMHLNVDTSWYLRYRGTGNPDFGDTFPQVVDIVDRPGIPLHDGYSDAQIQAIADTAAWHFPMIEQGGSSLYDALSLNALAPVTLRIITSIGGSEVMHFEIWHDVVGHVVPVDSGDGLVFDTPPDSEDVMPKPCKFIDPNLPLCAVIRPTSLVLAGAQAAVQFLTDTGLFNGQSQNFFAVMQDLAVKADRAMRH